METALCSINSLQYPACASLAHDFLSIMATSVWSEKALSSAGITMTANLQCKPWHPPSSENAKLSMNAAKYSKAIHRHSGPGSMPHNPPPPPTQGMKPLMCPMSLTTHEPTLTRLRQSSPLSNRTSEWGTAGRHRWYTTPYASGCRRHTVIKCKCY
jgi:hypothetical protein